MKAAVALAALGYVVRLTESFVASPFPRNVQSSTRREMSSVCRAESVDAVKGSTRRRVAGVCMATSSELDNSAEYVKAELARVQEEYEAKRKAKLQEDTKQAAARGDAAVTPLAELELMPYLDEDGMITKVDTTGVKASVYAVYDESKTIQYIGVSRGIQQSLRLHLARRPTQTYFFKVQNIARPSRSLLEIVKDSWIEENGSTPPGNDQGEQQAIWEASFNVMPLFTEEDKIFVEEKKQKGREESGIKAVARRFEAEIVEILTERGVKESMRFDPKLKGKGLLDLFMKKPNTSVPK
eukprot:jgi/Undpi1/3907/HiC_scaffold_16.g07275.m1